jgi:FtsH-binding integral membrane protein
LEELVNDYRYGPASQTGQTGALTGARLSSTLLTQSFFWMFMGLLLTAFVAFLVENNLGLAESVVNLWIVLVIAEMVLGVGIQAGIRRLSASTALALFFVFAALNGLTFGVIVLAYTTSYGTPATVVEAFLSAAAMFGGAAVFGLVTRRNMADMFGILAMATWGLLVAILLNLLFNNSMLDLLISVVGVVIYAALTASTTQKITRGDFAYLTGSVEKAAVWGALLLYIEFVTIFMFMLRLFGGGRR